MQIEYLTTLKKMNFVVKLKWLQTIYPKLIRDRCTSGLISSTLLNDNVSILLDQCYLQFNLNIILLNLWWYLFFSSSFLDGSWGMWRGECSGGCEQVYMYFQSMTLKYLVEV